MSCDRVTEFVSTLTMVTASPARIADEIRILNRWEIGELEVDWTQQQIGSSTMSHKRNPEGCRQVAALVRLAKVQVLLTLDAIILKHERDYRDTRLEWCAVADASHYALMALPLLTDTIDGFTVYDETMARTANAYSDVICTEAFVFEVAKQLSKSSAYEIIFEVTQACQRRRIPMRQALESDPRVGAVIPKETLARLFEPRSHLGMAGTIVDKVLDKVANHH